MTAARATDQVLPPSTVTLADDAFFVAGSRREHPECDRSSADQEHGPLKEKTFQHHFLRTFVSRKCPELTGEGVVVYRSGRSLELRLGEGCYLYTPLPPALGAL